ncbi:hypothetical protein CERSUDRAFT_97151 [Gelatoporia subvermispora B]|uniref:Secreted protein n=1 Tax=Ceriporiopsis subvermispora (strain B) TaxID=914234 RepID=M2R7Z8_CERS8|nr:hypothetical protein CERSUDRAFT_97151 [Gelatoporia subvermispora B]
MIPGRALYIFINLALLLDVGSALPADNALVAPGLQPFSVTPGVISIQEIIGGSGESTLGSTPEHVHSKADNEPRSRIRWWATDVVSIESAPEQIQGPSGDDD